MHVLDTLDVEIHRDIVEPESEEVAGGRKMDFAARTSDVCSPIELQEHILTPHQADGKSVCKRIWQSRIFAVEEEGQEEKRQQANLEQRKSPARTPRMLLAEAEEELDAAQITLREPEEQGLRLSDHPQGLRVHMENLGNMGDTGLNTLWKRWNLGRS